MSGANLYHMLAESQSNIFDTISPSTAGMPRLRAVQDAVFSCLLSLLGGEDPQALEPRIAAAARNSALSHSLSEQINAVDQLEAAALALFRSRVSGEPLTQKFLQTANFFCATRRIVGSVYSHSLAQYLNLIDKATDVIFILDTEGRFVSFNKRAEEVTGCKAEDWLGRSFQEIIGPDELPDAVEKWSGGVKCSAVTPVAIRNARGENAYFEVNSSRIEEDGVWKGMLCIARDVTLEVARENEFRKLHDSVVDANRKLEESMEKLKAAQAKLIQTEKLSAMGELISGIAHELNNPLTGIMGYSQFLLESVSEPKAQESVQKINREAVRCKRIVQNLLGFARQQKPQKQIVDLNAVVQSVVDLREYHLRSDGIHLVMRLTDGRRHVMGDFHQLQQVTLNILNNAHQAIMRNGKGGKIEIETDADQKEECARIFIVDDGPGITAEDLPKIFDPFFTTKEVGQGTGLGLSVAYGIVQEHGGHIMVESKPGKGAVFQIRLPLAEARVEHPRTPSVQPLPRDTGLDTHRVLVVDDEEVIVELLTDILSQMDLTVEKACNGEEAFRKIMATNFDLIICDLKMPGMDGRTLYYKIQELRPELKKRMILCTGDTLDKDFIAFRASTHCKFLEKPFLIEDLKAAIQQFLPQTGGKP